MIFGPNTDNSGGTRYSKGKPSFWWAMPLGGLRLVAKVTEYGASKYAPLDWAVGQSYSTLIDCTFRHMVAVVEDGIYSKDKESGLYHLSHAAWNILTLLTFVAARRYDLDDVTVWRGRTAGQPALPLSEVDAYDSPEPHPSAVPPPAACTEAVPGEVFPSEATEPNQETGLVGLHNLIQESVVGLADYAAEIVDATNSGPGSGDTPLKTRPRRPRRPNRHLRPVNETYSTDWAGAIMDDEKVYP